MAVPPPLPTVTTDIQVSHARGGWTVTLPAVLIASLISVVVSRLLPTAVTDERAALAAERRDLVDERWREEQRRTFAALREDVNRLETRITVLEAIARAKP